MFSQSDELCQLSVREPYASFLCGGVKKIENRSQPFPLRYLDKWIAIQTSLRSHHSIDSAISRAWHYNRKKLKDVFGSNANSEFRLKTHLTQKFRLGHIVGFIKITQSLICAPRTKNKELGMKHDNIWCDFPKTTGDLCLWLVSDSILLPPREEIKSKGGLGVRPLKGIVKRTAIQKLNQCLKNRQNTKSDHKIKDKKNSLKVSSIKKTELQKSTTSSSLIPKRKKQSSLLTFISKKPTTPLIKKITPVNHINKKQKITPKNINNNNNNNNNNSVKIIKKKNNIILNSKPNCNISQPITTNNSNIQSNFNQNNNSNVTKNNCNKVSDKKTTNISPALTNTSDVTLSSLSTIGVDIVDDKILNENNDINNFEIGPLEFPFDEEDIEIIEESIIDPPVKSPTSSRSATVDLPSLPRRHTCETLAEIDRQISPHTNRLKRKLEPDIDNIYDNNNNDNNYNDIDINSNISHNSKKRKFNNLSKYKPLQMIES